MLISIITASYNSSKTIRETLTSVLNQHFADFEYIIIDGNSTDSTLTIIKEFENKFKSKGIPYRYISEKDTGIYDAWNKGLDLANGKWVSFLGSDDEFLPSALSIYNKAIVENGLDCYDVIHSKVKVVENGKVVNLINNDWSWNKFRHYMNIAHVGALHNKNYFKRFGKFNTLYEITGDYELLLRAGPGLKCFYVDSLTVKMTFGGVSTNNIKKVLIETLKAKIETGDIHPLTCWIDYYWAFFKWRIKNLSRL